MFHTSKIFENEAILDEISNLRIQFISRRLPVDIVLSFEMNFLWTSFRILSVLLLFQSTSGDEYETIRNKSSGPLALIQEGKTLTLAIPERVGKRKAIAKYTVSKIGENGLIPEFKTACAELPYNKEHKKIDKIWRKNSNIPDKKSELYYLREYTDVKMECKIASNARPGPSIKNTTKECANSEGEIYEVGYPVITNEEEPNFSEKIQFVAIYEICYSKGKNPHIIYTHHRIRSPSLLFLEPHRYAYRYMDHTFFFSNLDLETKKHLISKYLNKYVHQYVPRYDMPTVLWENTTFFHFNYIPTDMDKHILQGMSKFDDVIRLFIQQTKKPLRIYSGIHHETKIIEIQRGCFRSQCNIVEPIKSSLWRVIFDDEKNATILVTQYTPKKCESYVCQENRKILQEYRNGGCTYQCSVSSELLELLQLPEQSIAGILEIKYTTRKKIEKKIHEEYTQTGVGEDEATEQYGNVDIDISNFGGDVGFAVALMALDSVVAHAMQADGAIVIDGNADGGTDGGGDDGGEGQGHGNDGGGFGDGG